jgi:CubicO group peptidase (beta-lactamase class C family)
LISRGFEETARLFYALLHEEKLHSAAQLVVLQRGEKKLDLSAGRGAYRNLSPDTPFLAFSITKAFTGLCIHRLIEEGRIDLDAPVSTYWPEFGQGGKERATIRHVFLHQAGIPAPNLNRQVLVWPFWRLVTRHVARTPAQFEPGTKTAYHLVNYGFILGEVVRRVTGKRVDRYLYENFLRPMGLRNTWMRLPPRALLRTPRVKAHAAVMRRAAAVFNQPAIRTALIPAAGLHTTARDLAAFFQMLLEGGTARGQRFLKPETIAAATSSGYRGWDDYLKTSMHWGYGFVLGGSAAPMRHGTVGKEAPEGMAASGGSMGKGSCEQTYGSFGMGTSMVWVDPCAQLVVAFTCNGMLDDTGTSRRWRRISDAVWDAVTGGDV